MKKSNLNKILIVLAVLIIGFVGYKFINKETMGEGTVGDKTIYVTMEDKTKNEVIVEKEEFKTNAKTLGEFLKENKERLKADLKEDPKFGTYIVGFQGRDTKDMKNGPWWMYGYSSPEGNMNYDIGQAPGVDNINIKNGDSVTFVFTSEM